MRQVTIIIAAIVICALGAGVYALAPSKSPSTVAKTAQTEGKGHADEKEHDGGVEMTDAKIAAAGIEVLSASGETLRESIVLNGILQPNQEALVQVTPRFPGVVREIRKRIGDTVTKGELLAKIESNQSLTVYDMLSPISGTVIDRQISLGEYASEQKPAFAVADLSTVWVDMSVYRRDLPRVKMGDTVLIDVGDGGKPIEAKISYVSPVGSADTQSALVRSAGGGQIIRDPDGREPQRRIRAQRLQVRGPRRRARRPRSGKRGDPLRPARRGQVRGEEQLHRQGGTCEGLGNT
jgi:cobalt-zinc-cadmium efflux system membrane fusion protein